MKTILCIMCSVFAVACSAGPADPALLDDQADGDDATVDGKADATREVAIDCYTGVFGESGATLRYFPDTGEYVAGMKINDRKVSNQVRDFDGLEHPRLRIVATNGMSTRVSLAYQETVLEDHPGTPTAMDVYRQAWKPAAPYTEIDHVKWYITVNGHPNIRYLCSIGVVSVEGEN